ncbi:MAG: vanadium-dependent haloperoxidase [Pseudomonadota bacterium]
MPEDRAESAYRLRVEAAAKARHRVHPEHKANPDEDRYAAAHYPMSFTKGLRHDPQLGIVNDPDLTADGSNTPVAFEAFRAAIDAGFVEPFTTRVPVPDTLHNAKDKCPRRKWEAPTAGVVYDLEGPDAQAVTMPPAPELCSDELAFEMAEVYELAMLRDVPLSSFDYDGGAGAPLLNAAVTRLNKTAYAGAGFKGRPRKTDENGNLDRQTVFRGSAPGVENGPYLSQFLWIGGRDQADALDLKDGKIPYGAQLIDQQVPPAEEKRDFMQLWDDWLVVQDGFDVNQRGLGQYNPACGPGQVFSGARRFIYTPRDLATYVHFDALYQAYLNATLILLGMGTPFDPGFAQLAGMRSVFNPASSGPIAQNAGGFALWGGPHILTLVTEVATRALKAVRFQKFNNHLRLRPEALAARIEKATEIDARFSSVCGAFGKLSDQIDETVKAIVEFNDSRVGQGSALLPMAFAEGSPMHPTYGAGHATVAGACTTIVKAFFDTGTILGYDAAAGCNKGKPGFYRSISEPLVYEAAEKGKTLKSRAPAKRECPLTLEGELNKLAANISIGRNMAGVHYFSDYYDSLRMGEEIAIGMLEEQALCYPTDDFVLSVPTFDGDTVRIGRK